MNYLISKNNKTNYQTELHETVYKQHDQEACNVLLAEGTQPLDSLHKNSRAGQRRLRTETVGFHATKSYSDELIDSLIKYGNNAEGIPALHAAIKGKDEKAVRMFLEHGADPNAQSRPYSAQHDTGGPLTVLDFAAMYGTPEIIRTLINHGAKVNVTSNESGTDNNGQPFRRTSPLHFSLQGNNPENIKILIENGADRYYSAKCGLYQGRASPIHFAAHLGNTEALKTLLQTEADANFLSPDEAYPYPPLLSALWSGKIATVKLLLEAGADLNLGKPRMIHLGGVQRLIPNVPFITSWVPFDKDPFYLLLDYDLDVNMQNGEGKTWLMELIYRYENCKDQKHLDVAFYLPLFFCIEAVLQRGADIEAKDPWNKNAFSFAKSPEIKELLRKYGAKG